MTVKEYLKEHMLDGIKELVPERDWGNIDSFFERVYVVEYDDDHDAYVFGYWDDPNPLLAFDAETYTFLSVVMQSWVEEHGTRII